MGSFRSGKLRWLYLLALVQLAGGPLVLLHVTVLCKLTLREAPREGFVRAAVLALHSTDFDKPVAAVTDSPRPEKSKAPPNDGPDGKAGKAKQPLLFWSSSSLRALASVSHLKLVDRPRVWTPAWPQAPPGPPPRLG